MSESDDDVPQLNPDTLAALKEFYHEREERENKLKAILETKDSVNIDVDFEEDWVRIQKIDVNNYFIKFILFKLKDIFIIFT